MAGPSSAVPDAVVLPEGGYTQTAYVVRDLEAAAARWTRVAGAGPWFLMEPATSHTIYRGTPHEDAYRLVHGFLGGSLVELIQPLDDTPSILNEVLDARGEGFHHIAPQVTGLAGEAFDERCAHFARLGLEVAMTNEVEGVGRATFFDALDTVGGFVEVFELGDGYPMIPAMARAHQTWDGSEPLRDVASLFVA